MCKIDIEKVELYQINEIENHRVSGTFFIEYAINGNRDLLNNINVSVVVHSKEISNSFNFKQVDFNELEKILVNRAKDVFRKII